MSDLGQELYLIADEMRAHVTNARFFPPEAVLLEMYQRPTLS